MYQNNRGMGLLELESEAELR
uniref:Uncharacterized protein n=1 Tax=Anguilla anguilla TaxID=7936 RepID=A0A0E9SE31_ANGAN